MNSGNVHVGSSSVNSSVRKEDPKDNLILYQKYLDLIYYTNDLLKKYPKCEKFALVNETKNTMYSGLRNLMYAYKEYYKKNKLVYLNNLDVDLNLQKIFLRLAYKYRYITKQNYETWSQKITDICNMLGGWIKSCLTK